MVQRHATIVVDGLTKLFGDFPAVQGLSFHVYSGEIFGFLGPNGSGKTTTIRMMLGLLPPTAGDIQVLGVPVVTDPGGLRSRVGYMSQQFSLYNDLTVEQNLRFYGTAYGLEQVELREGMVAAVEMAGLQGRERSKTGALSGGWRQRLALAAAILHQPKVVFLDEPTAGVDPVSRREFWELLYRLVEKGITVFVTTHYMDEAEHCHRLAFIQHGHLIATGTPQELKECLLKGRVVQINPEDAALAIKHLRLAAGNGELPLSSISLYGSYVHAVLMDETKDEQDVERSFLSAKIGVRSVQVIEPTLEDVFIACMEE